MLKISLHHGKPASVSSRNVLGRLDIGYARLGATADYKVVMQTTGLGEQAPCQLLNYPRWSASVWDLVMRAVCLSISRQEAIWPAEIPAQRRGAFIEEMTAVAEHWSDGLETRRSEVGVAHIAMCNRRCTYRASFEDDILGRQESALFTHSPDVLIHWDLLARAYAWTVNESFVLPPRPTLYVPIPLDFESKPYVGLDTVEEPARTGIKRWMARRRINPVSIDLLVGDCVTEGQFVTFLSEAV